MRTLTKMTVMTVEVKGTEYIGFVHNFVYKSSFIDISI